MPLPLILGIGAAVAGAGGLAGLATGGIKLKDAKDTMTLAKRMQETAIEKFKKETERTNVVMDRIGKKELDVMQTFEQFADTFEKIQNRPEFKSYHRSTVELPAYSATKLKEVSVGAGVLLGGIGGAAAGTAGGFAAAGATTAAVMALGTASTGTAISALSGVAATNATLAALGGGALAAGGGGIALGTTVLGAATFGVGLLVGGIIFSVTGNTLSGKADEALRQAKKTEAEVSRICEYLNQLRTSAWHFEGAFNTLRDVYVAHLTSLNYTVNHLGKHDWNDFTDEQKLSTENAVLLLSMIYKMCQTKLVLKSSEKDGLNKVNTAAINNVVDETNALLKEHNL